MEQGPLPTLRLEHNPLVLSYHDKESSQGLN